VPSIPRQWLRSLFADGKRPGQRPSRGRPSFRPTLELLEARVTPSVTFANQASFAAGNNPESVAVADFNGDGRPDLVVANYGAGTVSVYLNTAAAGATAPAFAAPVTFTVGYQPISVAVGDFNGDGRPDLAVANVGADTVSVLLDTTAAGATAPSFAAPVTFAVGNAPRSVAVGDFNGDGRPDLVVANDQSNTVSVLLNTMSAGATAPSFAPQITFTVGAYPFSVAVGDFNGDGRPDLAVANSTGAGTASVLLNATPAGATAPAFAVQQTFAVGNDPVSVAVGDFNGDGRPDLAVANANDGTASVLLNTTPTGAGTPAFAAQQTFNVGAYPTSLAVGDFNGDGRPDLAVSNSNGYAGTMSVLLNATPAGATAPSFAAQQTFAVGSGPFSVAVGDFNGDGRPDLAVANANDNTASVLLNTTVPFATAVPVVVADVHGMGVVEYNRTTGAWVQLNVANPSDVTLLATDAAGDVFADYPGYGVYRYSPSTGSWQMVNGTDAVALAADPRGDVFLSYNGAGVAVFRLDGGAQLLTPSTASMLAADPNGDLAGEFVGYGVFRYTPSNGAWAPLNGTDAVALTIDAQGDVFASFAGAGVAVFRLDGGAQLLNPTAATLLAADAQGELVADFPGYGVYKYQPGTTFIRLNPVDASLLAVDADGDIFADFPGYGVYEYQPGTTFLRLTPSEASLLAADPFGDPFASL